ncbi:MAG TPA: T9SS type A sorting domain-containing protein [Puia sp.]|nr:T9SS type A sorting domain-containing protein [Puia sp.]
MKSYANIVLLLTLSILNCHPSDAQSVSGVVNTYYAITAINNASNTVTVSNSSGLTPGQRVLLYQARGAAITSSTNTAAFGDITAANSAGAYEFNTICSISSNQVWLRDQFVNAYNVTGQVQLVTIPSYSSIVVAGTVTATPWSSTTGTGGIVALEASGTIMLNADIDGSGQGFEGGPIFQFGAGYNCSVFSTVDQYYMAFPTSGNFTAGKKGQGIAAYVLNQEYARGKQSNGGGGGNSLNTGGGGGGNYGAGGAGGMRAGVTGFNCPGQYPGIGGVSLAAYGYSTGINRIFFGGGGGSGHDDSGFGIGGGNGGGIIILSAAVITGGGGRLLASGIAATNLNPMAVDPAQAEGDGAGGAGAGGTIILNAPVISGALTAEAMGAKGPNSSNHVNDCTGAGGGGGGGVVWAAGASFPAAVTATVTGGANGIVSLGSSKGTSCVGAANGATPGATGATIAGYTAPTSTGTTCTVLALSDLKYFKADVAGADVVLSWELSSPDMSAIIRDFIVQRSADANHFITIATRSAGQDSVLYRYTDASPDVESTWYYRLAWQYNDGTWAWSRIVAVNTGPPPATFSFQLQPNPALQHLTLTIFSTGDGNASVAIASAQGQLIQSFRTVLHKGANTIPVDLRTLAPATYFLIVEEGGRRVVKPFIKKGE